MTALSIPTDDELKDRSYRVMRHIWKTLPVLTETVTKDADIGAPIDLAREQIREHRHLYTHLGLMQSRTSYTGGRKHVLWQLLVDEAEAYKRLDAHFAAGGKWNVTPEAEPKGNPSLKPARTTTVRGTLQGHGALPPLGHSARVPDETVAIVGPDPVQPLAALAPARKDEGKALVEAARQYQSRSDAVIEHLKAIEALGIKVDRVAAMGAIELGRDERLENVSDVLDYVTELEAKNAKLERQIASLNMERRDLLGKVTELDSLRAANRRLSERNTTLSAQINAN